MHKLFFQCDNEAEAEDENSLVSAATSVHSYNPRLVQFGNTRLQLIYKSPNIYIIDQFLSATDIQYLFTHFISKYKFQRSFVDDVGVVGKGTYENECETVVDRRKRASQQSRMSSHRTSSFLALNKQHDSRIASIEDKVASLFGCTAKHIEALQLVRYQSPDQYFNVHHDLGVYDETTGNVELPKKSIWYQRRMITLFCYLNTIPPENGGATYFPCCKQQNSPSKVIDNDVSPIKSTASIVKARQVDIKSTSSMVEPRQAESEHQDSSEIDPDCATQNKSNYCGNSIDRSIVCDHEGLRVYPVTGRAVVFSNVLASGVPDSRSIHAGEPILVSRTDNARVKIIPDLKYAAATQTSSSKRDTYHCNNKTKYGLNIWICEN
jgi:hypothetical protein